jgi:ribosomal protein L12E/L44/L45/RPP1/RPP2
MKQLSGVDMNKLLRDISSLPAAVAKGAAGDDEVPSRKTDKVFGE